MRFSVQALQLFRARSFNLSLTSSKNCKRCFLGIDSVKFDLDPVRIYGSRLQKLILNGHSQERPGAKPRKSTVRALFRLFAGNSAQMMRKPRKNIKTRRFI